MEAPRNPFSFYNDFIGQTSNDEDMRMKLLLAEDEEELSRALGAILRHHNYTVDIVKNGTDALAFALTGGYDGILLDIMMPGMNGIEVLAKLRQEGITAPALFLTAKGEIEDRIAGLDAGGDDYLAKPFDTGELLARIKAMLRRRENYTPDILSFGDISLDSACSELKTAGGSVQLGKKEYQVMEMLMTNPGQLISTELFLERIWGIDSEPESNVVWVYISNIRKKLGAAGSRVRIVALRNLGYKLEDGK